MTNHRQVVGRWGELEGAAYLEKIGWQILERNVRTPFGELDIVAKKDGIVIFVEVKTRTSTKFGNPEDAVDARKLAHLQSAAGHYAETHSLDNWQIDALSVEGKPGKPAQIFHFENVLSG